jgi:hypothetical protein
VLPEGDAQHESLANRRAGQFNGKLSSHGGDDEREARPSGLRVAGKQQDGGRADGVPRVHELEREALRMDLMPEDFGQRAGDQAGGDTQGHDAGREQEQHGHEHDLGDHGRTGPDLELDARGEGVRSDQHERHAEAVSVVPRTQGRQERRRDGKRGRAHRRHDSVAAGETERAARSRCGNELAARLDQTPHDS